MPKKRKKNKIKSQSHHSKRREWKKNLKKKSNQSAYDRLTRVRQTTRFPHSRFETAGMGKMTKKKPQK